MIHPIECSDEWGLEGLKDAAELAQWLNSWMRDDDATECVITKLPKSTHPYDPDNYTLAPAQAGEAND